MCSFPISMSNMIVTFLNTMSNVCNIPQHMTSTVFLIMRNAPSIHMVAGRNIYHPHLL